jgi:alginate O-acetyltransferase complex protein AlgJ
MNEKMSASEERVRARVTREEQAAAELGVTEFAPGVRAALVWFFLVTIVAVPVAQLVAARREPERVGDFGEALRGLVPDAGMVAAVGGVGDVVRLLPEVGRLKAIEEDWERDSVVGEALLPRVQRWLLESGQGNEKAYVGRDGWLFYRADVEYVTGRGFLEEEVMRRRGKEVQADPVRAIVDFRDQLAGRGIGLLVVPAPVKPTIHPERFAGGVERAGGMQNASFGEFVRRLGAAGVVVYDPVAELMKEEVGAAYLKTDTHWLPGAMERVAEGMAAAARASVELPGAEAGRFRTVSKTVRGSGDIAQMLKVRPERGYPEEEVEIRQVMDGSEVWRPSGDAAVLLLGDSFANIYSLGAMGWGESAGLAEHFSERLGLPVDVISRNDEGSHATREMLVQELGRGRDRLAGKRLVVWEFAARELASGDWKLLPLEVGERREAGMYTVPGGRVVRVRGAVRAVSAVPRPGSVPYKDHIMSVRVTDVESADDAGARGKDVIVFVWSMRDQVPTAAAKWREGEVVELQVRPWGEVSGEYEAINRSELDDEEAMLADPAWAVAEEK